MSRRTLLLYAYLIWSDLTSELNIKSNQSSKQPNISALFSLPFYSLTGKRRSDGEVRVQVEAMTMDVSVLQAAPCRRKFKKFRQSAYSTGDGQTLCTPKSTFLGIVDSTV